MIQKHNKLGLIIVKELASSNWMYPQEHSYRTLSHSAVLLVLYWNPLPLKLSYRRFQSLYFDISIYI